MGRYLIWIHTDYPQTPQPADFGTECRARGSLSAQQTQPEPDRGAHRARRRGRRAASLHPCRPCWTAARRRTQDSGAVRWCGVGSARRPARAVTAACRGAKRRSASGVHLRRFVAS